MSNLTDASNFASEMTVLRMQGDISMSSQKGIQGLVACGLTPFNNNDLSKRPAENIEEFKAQISKLLIEQPLETLIDGAECSDDKVLIELKILPILALNQYALTLEIEELEYYCLYAVLLTLQHGVSPSTTIILSTYASYKALIGDYAAAHDIAEIALKFWDKKPNSEEIPSSLSLIAGLALHFKSPVARCIDLHNTGYELALEENNVNIALLNFNNLLHMHLAQGNSIKDVFNHTQDQLFFLKNNSLSSTLSIIVNRYTEALLLDCDLQPKDLLRESDVSQNIPDIDKQAILHFSYLLAFWQDDLERAYDLGIESHRSINKMAPFIYLIDHYLFFGLTILMITIKRKTITDNDLSIVKECLDKLEQLSELNPENFSATHCLLNAAYHQATDDEFDRVLALFREAIQTARLYGFTQYEALSNELLGKYLEDIGLTDYAQHHLTEAHYLYDTWRCKLKVSSLEKQYPFLESIVTGPSSSTPPALAIVTSSDAKPISSSSHTPARVESIIESAQALTEKRDREELYRYLTKTLIKHSSASRGILVFQHGKKFEVACDAEMDTKLTYNPLPSSTLNFKDMPELLLVRQVCEQKNNILIETANQASIWTPRIPDLNTKLPIVSLPIFENGTVCGAILLEHVDLGNPNGDEILDILHLLLAQASVALENVNYYEKLQSIHDELESRVQQRSEELEAANKELEAFSYSVSHDLRGPLRSIRGFTQALIEDHVEDFDDIGKDYLNRIFVNSGRMSLLIEGLIQLSRVSRVSLSQENVDLSAVVNEVSQSLSDSHPTIFVEFKCEPNLVAKGDSELLKVLVENLLSNAWKFSSKEAFPKIEFGSIYLNDSDTATYYVRDNGVGFDMVFKGDLFRSFRRLHSAKDFEGTGIGLATAQRIIDRHQGKIWAEAQPGDGATFYFTLGH